MIYAGFWSTRRIADVTAGNSAFNGLPGYDAAAGWDFATGWGTPIASSLIPQLAR